MAVTAACFKWADVLENQFDKSWVELDTTLSQLEDDEVIFYRKCLAGSCLIHVIKELYLHSP